VKFKSTSLCFNINSIHQAFEVISICKKNNIIPILYIKFYLINGFGTDWINGFNNLLLKNYNKNDYKLFIECKENYGLFISLVRLKIKYLFVNGNNDILLRLKQIAKINNVIINPKFDIIDITKIKNIKLKVKKILIEKSKK